MGEQGPNFGLGFGSKTGKQKTATVGKPTKIQSQMQAGQIIGKVLVDGPQIKGQATAEQREAVTAAQRDMEDAIEHDQIPRQYERATRQYFERLAGLIGEKAAKAGEKAKEGEEKGGADRGAEKKPAEKDEPASDSEGEDG